MKCRWEQTTFIPISHSLNQSSLPENICEALKALQTTNTPFPNEEAFQVISDQLGNTGPLDATGRLPLPEGCSADNPPLFRKLSADCIASASLGQVYKAETMDGREVAVKVQRPTALRQCLLDASIITVGLKIIEQTNFWNGDLLEVYDGVAKGVVQELDFRWEARNARTFADSLAFLGYVTVPQALPEFTVGPNVVSEGERLDSRSLLWSLLAGGASVGGAVFTCLQLIFNTTQSPNDPMNA